MKKLLMCGIAVTLFMLSCRQPYIYVEKSISHSKVLSYNINTAGAINQSSNLYMDELVKALTDGLDGQLLKRDYTIKELTVESVNLSVIQNPDNTAHTMKISSFVANHNSSVSLTHPLLQETDILINKATLYVANTYLIVKGVDAVNSALADAVKRLYRGAFLKIDIKGSPIPSNARVSATLNVDVKFNMQYSYCEESIFAIDGPICP